MGKRNAIDVGCQIGSWRVVSRHKSQQRNRLVYVCECEHGHKREFDCTYLLTHGHRKCRLCISANAKKRRLHYERLHAVYVSMRARCERQSESNSWIRYGARGITVCDEWRQDFEAFYEWSLSHGYSPGMQIDRIDNNGPYSPDNCRWVDGVTNGANKRNNVFLTAFGNTKTLSEWSRDARCVVSYQTLRARIVYSRYDAERAITEPVSRDAGV